ncbi:hypothetical protein [Pedobacter steynii]|uniref:Uncharacterized protein n=1 Tax=Pedobacter steynii TaxID=430522 RepID=A0A1D7QMQ9_9SPHI|nr:hypothetical protein [Pedobacter steynii]AOM79944.1 hypothetical protein BFS30_23935 [Pedobacter steynii]
MKKESKDNLNELPRTCVTKLSDNERLLKDIFRSDIDKLKLFTKMLRTNSLLDKAVIIHK